MAPTEVLPARDPTTCILSRLAVQPQTDADVNPLAPEVRERTWQWARPQVEGPCPCPRGGHTATLVHPRKGAAKIFVFGGSYDSGSSHGGQGFVYLNDTFVLDIDANKWTSPSCRGTVPEARYGHSAALVGSRVVYFGGKGKGQYFRDLHALDTDSLTWFQGPASGGAPSNRYGHTATLQGTRLFVFGGACGMRFFEDLHCLDLASMAWSSPATEGPKPAARYGHAALLIGDSLLVHGGFSLPSPEIAAKDNSGELMKACYRDDLRVLDLNKMIWSRLRIHGSPPTGRFGHTLLLSDDDVVMFGGWDGSRKEPAAVAFSIKEKTRGEDGNKDEETNDYCMTLRTADMQWQRNRYVGNAPCRRYGHSVTAIGPHIIVFGGWDGGKPLNDVVVLRDSSVEESLDEATDFDVPPNPEGDAEAAMGFEMDDGYGT